MDSDAKIMIPSADGYYFRLMNEKEFFPLFGPHYERIFGEEHTFFADEHYSPDEKEKLRTLRKRLGDPYKLHIGVFSSTDDFVGWSFGYQEDGEKFFMVCSAILEEHRRKGLYSALLDFVLEMTVKEGFQIIASAHCATNNAVIIPKLKAGFVIAKLELTDLFGVTVQLRYFTNPLRRKVMDYRCGFRRPDESLKY